MDFLKMFFLYFIIMALFAILDIAWFLITKRFYQNRIESLVRTKFDLSPAALLYLLFAFGLMLFVIVPVVNNNSLLQALGLGMLFGFFTHVTFALRNMNTIRDYPVSIVLCDIARGVVMSGIVCTAAFYISHLIK
jgi:uncharacterized membrane protein